MIYIDSKKIDENYWLLENNNDIYEIVIPKLRYSQESSQGSFLTIKTTNPRITVIFVDNSNKMIELIELAKEIRIVQEPNLELTQLALPVYIKAGEDFKSAIIFYDNEQECYKDELTLDEIIVSVSDNEGTEYLSNNDFLITSRADVIHRVEYNFDINKSIIVDNIKHFRMIEYVKNKYLIPNLIKNKYKIIDS